MNQRTYEDLATVSYTKYVAEAYKGSDIVDWYGRIEQSLVRMIRDADTANNDTYSNRLTAYLRTWRNHPIDGSINRETVDVLHAAARQWAEEDWDFQTYFLGLSSSLSQLIASEEELPRGADMEQNEPPSGGHGGGGGSPPVPSDFGPQSEAPGGEEGLGGDGGGGGGGLGAGAGGPGGPAGQQGAEEPQPGEEPLPGEEPAAEEEEEEPTEITL